MNFHGLAGARKEIYSKNLLRIYSLPPWRNMFFSPADFADFRRGFSTTDLFSPFKFSKIFSKDFERSDP